MSIYKNIGNVKVDMKRNIHPVGQGAFYSEQFKIDDKNKYVFVYDCGGTSNRTSECIQRFVSNLDQDKVIDALFVSHFHCDHINGIKELFSKTKIKKIYIPAVAPSVLLVDLFFNLSKGDYGFAANEFILEKFLPSLSEEESNREDVVETQVIKVHESDCVTVCINNFEWKYETYSMLSQNADEECKEFLKQLLSHSLIDQKDGSDGFLKEDDYQNILHEIIVKNQIDTLCSEFKTIFKGNQNRYSLIVYSHKGDNTHSINETQIPFENCLYTGDVPITDEVAQVIQNMDIDMIQVPHHGSKNNFALSIYHQNEKAFISVGRNNRYHHPDMQTVDKIANKCSSCRIVTEESEGLEYTFKFM